MMTTLRAVARHLALLAAIVVACGTSAAAQSPATLPKIGVLWQTSPPPPANPYMTLLMGNLRELGWEDGKSIVMDYRYGGNHPERLAELARDLAGRKVDVITTIGDLSTRAAQRATTTIPIVAVVGFPVESGFVKALARPGGNITGVAVLADELATKRLDLLNS